MKWPWSRNGDHEGEGRRAHLDAQHQLAETRKRRPEVNRVAASLRQLRERNHFAEQAEYLFRGGKP